MQSISKTDAYSFVSSLRFSNHRSICKAFPHAILIPHGSIYLHAFSDPNYSAPHCCTHHIPYREAHSHHHLSTYIATVNRTIHGTFQVTIVCSFRQAYHSSYRKFIESSFDSTFGVTHQHALCRPIEYPNK